LDYLLNLVIGIGVATLTGLIPLIGCIVLEHVGPLERYSIRDRVAGLLMNGVSMALSFVLVMPLAALWRALGIAPAVTIPLWQWLEPLGVVGLAVQFLVLVAFADFLAYWRHRAEHAFFWPVHAVHHSPRELHAANSIGHSLQTLFSLTFISVPMSLIQMSGPEVPAAIGIFVGMLSYYIHSPIELNFGPLRRVVVDNRFHRIHHSLEERHFDKNFGICFSLWDYLFGTAYDPGEEWPSVGLADRLPPANIREFLVHPFVQSPAPGSTPPGEAVSAKGGA
jgi:sterol desaturase/sphingolipid hydroxylase (fatty acid hydroxylase superfamily)